MEKKYNNLVWSFTAGDYLEIIERAKAAGLKPGESIEKYLFEYAKEKGIKPIGGTNKDIDGLTGEFRDKGKKVLNLNEIVRRKKEK